MISYRDILLYPFVPCCTPNNNSLFSVLSLVLLSTQSTPSVVVSPWPGVHHMSSLCTQLNYISHFFWRAFFVWPRCLSRFFFTTLHCGCRNYLESQTFQRAIRPSCLKPSLVVCNRPRGRNICVERDWSRFFYSWTKLIIYCFPCRNGHFFLVLLIPSDITIQCHVEGISL